MLRFGKSSCLLSSLLIYYFYVEVNIAKAFSGATTAVRTEREHRCRWSGKDAEEPQKL